jgi:hypothetical protein
MHEPKDPAAPVARDNVARELDEIRAELAAIAERHRALVEKHRMLLAGELEDDGPESETPGIPE